MRSLTWLTDVILHRSCTQQMHTRVQPSTMLDNKHSIEDGDGYRQVFWQRNLKATYRIATAEIWLPPVIDITSVTAEKECILWLCENVQNNNNNWSMVPQVQDVWALDLSRKMVCMMYHFDCYLDLQELHVHHLHYGYAACSTTYLYGWKVRNVCPK